MTPEEILEKAGEDLPPLMVDGDIPGEFYREDQVFKAIKIAQAEQRDADKIRRTLWECHEDAIIANDLAKVIESGGGQDK